MAEKGRIKIMSKEELIKELLAHPGSCADELSLSLGLSLTSVRDGLQRLMRDFDTKNKLSKRLDGKKYRYTYNI